MSLLALQERLSTESSAVMEAAEGLSPEARMLTQLAETRRQIKSLTELEKDLTKGLKEHIESTGEMVTNGRQIAVLQERKTTVWDEDGLCTVLGDKWQKCQSFDAKKLDALLKLGDVKEETVAPCKTQSVSHALTIKEDK